MKLIIGNANLVGLSVQHMINFRNREIAMDGRDFDITEQNKSLVSGRPIMHRCLRDITSFELEMFQKNSRD